MHTISFMQYGFLKNCLTIFFNNNGNKAKLQIPMLTQALIY